MIGSMQDIIRQRMEEQRLKVLESVITHTTDGVIITSRDTISNQDVLVIYINEAFSRMTGYTPKEMIRGSVRILYGPKTDKKELNRLWQAMENGESCKIELINYKKSGEEYCAQMLVFPLHDKSGNYSRYIAITKDITDRKKHELENERLIKDLTCRINDLRQFTYITSHNLRSPLTNLLGLVTLTEDIEVENETLRTIHAAFKTTAETLIETINDLVDILNTKDNQIIKMEENVVSDVLNHILDQLFSPTDDTRPVITSDFKEVPVINFHKVYFESILSNLLTNAIKYRSPVRRLSINIATHIVDNRIVLTFEDNGIGLDVERHKNRLFGFYQKFHDNSVSKGMGLYLVKSQMEELGGTVVIESKLNEGTKLILTFTR
jgi:PAS domain S-box-containing protein